VPKRKAAKPLRGETLLIELLTEELPPRSLARLADAFGDAVFDGLKAQYFLSERSRVETFATPRRLAARVSDVLAVQPDRIIERKGPAVASAIDTAGKPTPALLGFARSCGVDPGKLERHKDDKGEYFIYRAKQKGEPLARHLPVLVEAALKKLPVAKLMRWGAREVEFVRPVHGAILLHGSKVVPGAVLGVKAGNQTRGHRFLSKGEIVIRRPSDYEKDLRRRGHVIASFAERRDVVVHELDKAAAKVGRGTTWRLGKEMQLVDEVTSIVESPRVYLGAFEESFLDVPRECLIVSMQQHQKYFPLAGAGGRLQAHFLFVANMHPRDPKQIIRGNERVLRARLSDARFFYNQDRRLKLAERVPRLKDVVYHNKLGSQLERVQRLQRLAGAIAAMLKADVAGAERAAYLCKADLLTDMVGEFPELQGVMGRYYALHDGEAREVADAIAQHYLPRAAGDELPEGEAAVSVALADRLDTLVGIFGIGHAPTGEKDPFGLRRAAIGVVRLLIEKKLPLDLKDLIERARPLFTQAPMVPNVSQQVLDFFYDRLRSYLREQGYAADEIEAVLALKPTRVDQIPARLEAIKKFRALPEGMALSAANKRIRNILRQAGGANSTEVKAGLLQEDAEKKLAEEVQTAANEVDPLLSGGDYAHTLQRLAQLRPVVDEFFDRVLVMVDDTAVRGNRLALLNRLGNLFLRVADVSRLQG